MTQRPHLLTLIATAVLAAVTGSGLTIGIGAPTVPTDRLDRLESGLALAHQHLAELRIRVTQLERPDHPILPGAGFPGRYPEPTHPTGQIEAAPN